MFHIRLFAIIFYCLLPSLLASLSYWSISNAISQDDISNQDDFKPGDDDISNGDGPNNENQPNIPDIPATSETLPTRNTKLTGEVREKIGELIGWQPMPQADNLCYGVYQEPNIDYLQSDFNGENLTRIRADQVISVDNRTTLQGNVSFEQPGQLTTADNADVYRDDDGNIVDVYLTGNIEMREPGRLVLGDRAAINVQDNSGVVDNAIFRITRDGIEVTDEQIETSCLDGIVAWGRADQLIRVDENHYEFTNATYATCPPTMNSWSIEAKNIRLDLERDQGFASHATLKVKGVPVFYTPYYSFPLSDKRKTGFLTPTIGYNTRNGLEIGTPFYLNLAPNYDATITPTLYSERGIMLSGQGRYITKNSSGIINASILPNDRKYTRFQQDNPDQFPPGEHRTRNRSALQIDSETRFTENWAGRIDYNAVSDDFYLQDFGSGIEATTQRQLVQRADLTYRDQHWNFLGRVQRYQTLRPFNQVRGSRVYTRAPQLQLTGNYPDQLFGANLRINTNFDNFIFPEPEVKPSGLRFHINPVATIPLESQAAYLTPNVELMQTNYQIRRGFEDDFDRSTSRTVPIATIDSGVYFERNTSLFSKNYTQTLEPRLFYVYIPFVDQERIPNFDSRYYIFTYDQLFRANRFSGLDRIGDTNQISYALTTRFLSAETGEEKFFAGIGQAFYFVNRKVLLNSTVVQDDVEIDEIDSIGFLDPNDRVSPIAGILSYNFNPQWNLTADAAYDPNLGAMNNSNLNLFYRPDPDRILNFGYSFLLNGERRLLNVIEDEDQDTNLHQFTASYAWPLPFMNNIRSIGTWTYNISKRFAMEYYFGLEYEACCWAVRVIGGRQFTNLELNQQAQFKNSVYVQFLLKGAGTINFTRPDDHVLGQIPQYRDIFV